MAYITKSTKSLGMCTRSGEPKKATRPLGAPNIFEPPCYRLESNLVGFSRFQGLAPSSLAGTAISAQYEPC